MLLVNLSWFWARVVTRRAPAVTSRPTPSTRPRAILQLHLLAG